MLLTQTLISRLSSIFNIDPKPVLAFRLTYNGTAMTWTVADGVLTTVITGGTGAAQTIALTGYTMSALVTYLSSQTGYTVSNVNISLNSLKATVLLDGSGASSATNGDHVYAYTYWLYSMLDAFSAELANARTQITNMLAQFSTRTATGEWLDDLGTYYAVPRNYGESDALYGTRIIASIIKDRGNNKAIEIALFNAFGEVATVTDVQITINNHFDGLYQFDGTNTFSGLAQTSGLFDVSIPFNSALGLTRAQYTAQVNALVESLRAAGNIRRTLTIV